MTDEEIRIAAIRNLADSKRTNIQEAIINKSRNLRSIQSDLVYAVDMKSLIDFEIARIKVEQNLT